MQCHSLERAAGAAAAQGAPGFKQETDEGAISEADEAVGKFQRAQYAAGECITKVKCRAVWG